MEEQLATGFRFYPTEEELISFYLLNKLEGRRADKIGLVIPDIDIYSNEPWDLPKCCGELCHGDTEQWFFFTPRQQREAQGGRPNRTTASGYWKATGSPAYVYSSDNRAIGVKKTMVFYKGKAPTGRKTKWKMNEYRAIEAMATSASTSSTTIPQLRNEFRLCRVYVVSGSSRAFDRRPLELAGAQTQDDQNQSECKGTSSCSQNKATLMMEKKSSSDETYSYSGELVYDLPESGAGNNSTINWEMNGGLEQPLWEWEQLNLL